MKRNCPSDLALTFCSEGYNFHSDIPILFLPVSRNEKDNNQIADADFVYDSMLRPRSV